MPYALNGLKYPEQAFRCTQTVPVSSCHPAEGKDREMTDAEWPAHHCGGTGHIFSLHRSGRQKPFVRSTWSLRTGYDGLLYHIPSNKLAAEQLYPGFYQFRPEPGIIQKPSAFMAKFSFFTSEWYVMKGKRCRDHDSIVKAGQRLMCAVCDRFLTLLRTVRAFLNNGFPSGESFHSEAFLSPEKKKPGQPKPPGLWKYFRLFDSSKIVRIHTGAAETSVFLLCILAAALTESFPAAG